MLPACLKCQKKGIECSGQGREYKFSSYMRRHKSTSSALPAPSQPRASRPRDSSQRDTTGKHSLDIIATLSSTEYIAAADNPRWSLRRAIEPVPSQSRMLFNHCMAYSVHIWFKLIMKIVSTFIASKMVILDFAGNGYRHLILPMACQDNLVSEAVSVVAMFHLSQEMPSVLPEAEMRQQKVISKLRQSALMHSNIEALGLSAWITTLVLLVGDTITGSANYTILLQLLSCMAPSLTSDKKLPESTRLFISQQTRM